MFNPGRQLATALHFATEEVGRRREMGGRIFIFHIALFFSHSCGGNPHALCFRSSPRQRGFGRYFRPVPRTLRRLTGEEKRKSTIVCYKVNNFFHKRKHKRAKKRTLFARLRLFHSFFRPLSLSPSHDSARHATFSVKNAPTFEENPPSRFKKSQNSVNNL